VDSTGVRIPDRTGSKGKRGDGMPAAKARCVAPSATQHAQRACWAPANGAFVYFNVIPALPPPQRVQVRRALGTPVSALG
jgi:hypothetical protein